jgi:DNA-binding transcriptional MerR regulator
LRFWEKEIPDLNPQKTDTGVRQYRDADIELVRLIHHLVKVQGLTIKAARTRLKTSKAQVVDRQKLTARLENVLGELKIMQAKLDELCGKSL